MPTSDELSPLTFGNEDALPRVPLPTLEHSCARFLEWCTPLLTAEQLEQTRAAVAALADPASPAHALHAALAATDRAPGVHSWLDEFWDRRYLGRRDRIALNANYYFLFQDTGQTQLDRAAHLIAAALDFKAHIDAEAVPPLVQRGRPQSMEQLKYLFSATRIPGDEIDTVRTPYSGAWPGPATERHVVVLRRGRMYRLEVISPDGRAYGVAELRAGLAAVRDAIDAEGPAEPGTSVGHLTTGARAEWAAQRRALLELDPANARACETVESALCCLALEHEQPADVTAACDTLLHGDSADRWFDKAVTLIVLPDGAAGVNGEHCKLDGTTMVTLIDALAAWRAPEPEPPALVTPAHTPVTFVLDDALRVEVTKAGEAFAAYAAGTTGVTVRIEGFTAEVAKRLRCSPDAFVQLAYQLAHHRTRGHLGATYESIATRQFRHGRTEAMRVITPELVSFVEAMTDPMRAAEDQRAAFRAAAEAHVARARQCQQGDAPEQHLWALRMLAEQRAAELGVTGEFALYDSPGWTVLRDDYLSTSSVPSPNVRFWGFGSTSPRCIGVGYALMPDRFDLYLSTPAIVAEQMYTFAERLRRVLAELEELLTE